MTANDDEAAQYARTVHERASEDARKLLAKPNAMVFSAACDDADAPTRIAVVRVADESVAYETAVGSDTLAELDAFVLDAHLIWAKRKGLVEIQGIDLIQWDRSTGMDAAIRILNPDGSKLTSAQERRYPWFLLAWRSAGHLYASWYAEPRPEDEREPVTEGSVSRWVGKRVDAWLKEHTDYAPELNEPRPQPLPGATGEPVADARRIIQVLRDVADQTAPVSPAVLFA